MWPPAAGIVSGSEAEVSLCAHRQAPVLTEEYREASMWVILKRNRQLLERVGNFRLEQSSRFNTLIKGVQWSGQLSGHM